MHSASYNSQLVFTEYGIYEQSTKSWSFILQEIEQFNVVERENNHDVYHLSSFDLFKLPVKLIH